MSGTMPIRFVASQHVATHSPACIVHFVMVSDLLPTIPKPAEVSDL